LCEDISEARERQKRERGKKNVRRQDLNGKRSSNDQRDLNYKTQGTQKKKKEEKDEHASKRTEKPTKNQRGREGDLKKKGNSSQGGVAKR